MTAPEAEAMTLSPVRDARRAADPVLKVDGVTLALSDRARPVIAMEAAPFSIARGERIVLIGPSGCGKSSLLRAVEGLLFRK